MFCCKNPSADENKLSAGQHHQNPEKLLFAGILKHTNIFFFLALVKPIRRKTDHSPYFILPMSVIHSEQFWVETSHTLCTTVINETKTVIRLLRLCQVEDLTPFISLQPESLL